MTTGTRPRDEGVAMMLVIGIGAVITAFAITATTLSMNNLKNTVRDKQANSALATSEAGVAEAIEYLRSAARLSQLTCLEPVPAVDPGTSPAHPCYGTTMNWISKKAPMEVAIDGGTVPCTVQQTCYKVWISTVTPYDPITSPTGKYLIHATGKFGNGPASRSVVVEVDAKPYPFPIGVFAERFTGAGNTGVSRESVFSLNCIEGRASDTSNGSGLRFTGTIDLGNDIPPSAHSVSDISTGGCSQAGNFVHKPNEPCNTTLPAIYDQSGGGAALDPSLHSACYKKWTSPLTGKQYPERSSFTSTDLQNAGYRPRGLSDDIYALLESRARATGTYFTDKNANPHTALNALAGGQGVLYYKIAPGEKVTLGPTNIPSVYTRQESDTVCGGSSLVIVVEGGDLTLNSIGNGNTSPVTGLVGSMFVPDGAYAGQGGVWVIGTLFAKEAKLAGTQDFRLDRCFVKNPPSAVVDVQAKSFREDDSGNAG